ncbi:MAG: isochorismatase family protein [Planctomycetota bacterium]|nr:isochorismatase family protein [Planctomycetota bacterium]
MTLLSAEHSLLVVIDVQERLLPAIRDSLALAASIRFLMDAAAILQVSAIVTEQYSKGLGPTVELLRNHAATIKSIEKIRFSAANELLKTGAMRKQIVIAGIEAHICVQQTALELHDQGIQVFVAADCVGSRHADDFHFAIERMSNAGIIVTSAEAIAFEWCQQAGSDSFKALSRLVRDRDASKKHP